MSAFVCGGNRQAEDDGGCADDARQADIDCLLDDESLAGSLPDHARNSTPPGRGRESGPARRGMGYSVTEFQAFHWAWTPSKAWPQRIVPGFADKSSERQGGRVAQSINLSHPLYHAYPVLKDILRHCRDLNPAFAIQYHSGFIPKMAVPQ
jgi:hypothetical protein